MSRWWSTALAMGMTVTILMPAEAQEMRPQIPCPVMLVSGTVARGSLELSFMNRGKAPIQELMLGCSPPQPGRVRDAICHTESGLFYPGQRYRIQFPYAGAAHGAVVVTAKAALLGDGSRWMARAAGVCRPLRVSRGR